MPAICQNKLETPELMQAEILDLFFMAENSRAKSPEKSLDYSLRALEKAKLSNNDSLMAESYQHIGKDYQQMQNYMLAIDYLDSSMMVFSKIGDEILLARALHILGMIHQENKDYLSSIESYLNAAEMYKIANDSSKIGNVFNNLGVLYHSLSDFDRAAQYYLDAYNVANKTGNTRLKLTGLNNYGLILLHYHENDKALPLFTECSKLANELDDKIGLADAYLNIGGIYKAKQQVDSALKYFSISQELYDSAKILEIRSLLGKSEALILQHKQDEAIHVLETAFENETLEQEPRQRLLLIKKLYEYHEDAGNFTRANYWLKKYIDFHDEALAANQAGPSEILHWRELVREKQQEIEDLLRMQHQQQDKLKKGQFARRRNFIAAILNGLGLLVAMLLLGSFIKLYRKNKRMNKELNERIKLHEQVEHKLTSTNAHIAEQERNLRMLLNISPDLICVKDGEGRWQQANKAILERFELLDKDYLNKTDLELIKLTPAYKKELEISHLSDELCWQRGSTSRNEERFTDAEGKEYIIDFIKMPVYGERNNREAMIVLGRDITALKSPEQALQKMLDKAKEENKQNAGNLIELLNAIQKTRKDVFEFIKKQQEAAQIKEIEQFIKLIDNSELQLTNLIKKLFISFSTNSEISKYFKADSMSSSSKAEDKFLTNNDILVVEDDNESFILLKIILENLGAKVWHAKTGKEAIKLFQDMESFDLILMDIQLPDINGIELTKKIKKINPKIAIIAQTAYAMDTDKESCFEAGCDAYITKPIQVELLIPVLRELLQITTH